jgi:dihydrofolate synthase/folylpolyglutamate synthase
VNYRETIDFLYSQLPMFTRVGSAAYKTGLGNIEALCSTLGNPEQKFKSIHVAGTNGKGSSSHLLASVLMEAGYKTGLFTSPHLKDFRERIRINGKLISRSEVIRFVEKSKIQFGSLEPSFFEMNVALAFDYFARKKVDIAVIETGLGGRLDSTNVIIPELSLITNISFDHADLLGHTLELIASEKAGIIKSNVPVVVSEKQPETFEVFHLKALGMQSVIRYAEDEIRWENVREEFHDGRPWLMAETWWAKEKLSIQSPLAGNYQLKNLAGVLTALDRLKQQGWKISKSTVEAGIRKVIENTGLHGRWEMLSEQPRVFCDTGHNEAGVREVLKQIAKTPHQQLYLVWGMVSDKDVSKVLSLLPKDAQYYFCKAQLPRALDAKMLQEKALENGLKGKAYTSVRNALKAAKKAAQTNDLVVVGGSTFVVAEVV